MFSQQLGGAIFVSVGQNVFINDLTSSLSNILSLSAMVMINAGATDLQKTLPVQYLPEVLAKYNHALTRTFVISTGMMAASIIGSCFMEWKNIKTSKKPSGDAAAEKTLDEKKGETSEKEEAFHENKAETDAI